MAAVLKKGQSQLDWLWTNYSEIDVSDIALQSYVNELIENIENSIISSISYSVLPNYQLQILGYNTSGELISTSIIDMSSFMYTATDSSTISTSITDNVICSELILGTQDNTVVLQKVSDGVAARLNIAEDTEIDFSTTDGLKGTIPLKNTDQTVKFAILTMEEYSNCDIEEGTIYFISDSHYIYLNGQLYTTDEDTVRDFVDNYISLLVEAEGDGSGTIVIELSGIRDDIDDLDGILTWQDV